MEQRPLRSWLLAGSLALLALFSLYLALNRIYQVDETQNIYTARILASHWESTHSAWFELWHLWPLAWLAKLNDGAVGLLHAGRLAMLLVFWLNLLLLALACGVPWRSPRFAWVFLGAATLTPLWDYGFEIRHDNLLLLFLLAFWLCLRSPGFPSRNRVLALGGLAATMEFVTFKAFVYWAPMAALLVLLPPVRESRWRVLLQMLGGFAGATAALTGLIAATGYLPQFADSLKVVFGISVGPSIRVAPWGTLWRLVSQTPLLVGLGLAALCHTVATWSEREPGTSPWDGVGPECAMLTVSVLALVLHPFPLPYHLCLVAPFAYILGVRWLLLSRSTFEGGRPQAFLWAGLLCFGQLVPFAQSTLRHLHYGNDRQERLAALAERMTDPARDRVYDAAGLVSSRRSIGHLWFLHTLFMDRITRGEVPPVRVMLQENPASVLIPNYRFTWLQAQDVAYIQAHYLPLANDFYVLGQTLAEGTTTFACIHPGRYEITVTAAPGGSGGAAVALDGAPVRTPSVQELPAGPHTLVPPPGARATVTWVGPTLKEAPQLAPGAASALFVNWY